MLPIKQQARILSDWLSVSSIVRRMLLLLALQQLAAAVSLHYLAVL